MTAAEAPKQVWIIAAALLALFLGALDALVMSAAMPTVIADLGGLNLYAWTYTAFFLARAISLPIFGKLSDLYSTKGLFLFSISLFILASIVAGMSPSMGFLVVARVFQGAGGGGIFALVYVVLSDVSAPAQRAKTLSLASSVWGIASLIGPTLGGFVVTWFSWRWIFYMNVPIGLLSLAGIGFFFSETRKKPARVNLDLAGAALLSGFILGLLILIMAGGRELAYDSLAFILLAVATPAMGIGFFVVEKKAKDPMLDFSFFRVPAFALGNTLVFMASFTIFSLFAYAPLFLQGALYQTPMQVGYAMLSLSLGWSLGSLIAGRKMDVIGLKPATVIGFVFMTGAAGATLFFSRDTSALVCFFVFLVIGLGMGFVTLATLLVVQNSVGPSDLGVATSFHQFSRTMGGTIGVGICGAVVTNRLLGRLEATGSRLPESLMVKLQESTASLFQREFQAMVPDAVMPVLQDAVLKGVFLAFIIVSAASLAGLLLSFFLPGNVVREPLHGAGNQNTMEIE